MASPASAGEAEKKQPEENPEKEINAEEGSLEEKIGFR